jgi:4-phosphopantoate--beta-alanine ligase
VPVVDNIIRAVPNVTRHAQDLADASEADLRAIIAKFDGDEALEAAERAIRGGDLE